MLELLISSCLSYQPTEKTNFKCSLHEMKMSKTIVRTSFGRASTPNDNRFPNAKKRISMGCVVRPIYFAVVYHCRKCDKLKK